MIHLMNNYGSLGFPFSQVFKQAIDHRIKLNISDYIDQQVSQLEKRLRMEIRERNTDESKEIEELKQKVRDIASKND